MFSEIEIKTMNLKERMGAEILIDGNKISGVKSYTINQTVEMDVPTVTLEIVATNLSIDGVRIWK